MLESEEEDAAGAAVVAAVHEVYDEPTVVLRKHARSRPVVMQGEVTTILTVLKGQHHGQVVELRHGDTIMGRGQGVDLHLGDRGVSRHHARVSVDGRGRVELVDLGSTNGTFVNGERIVRESLRVGDRIRVGLDAVLEVGHTPLATTTTPERDAPVARKQRIAPTATTVETAGAVTNVTAAPAVASRADTPYWGTSETALDAYAQLLVIRRKRLGDHHPAVAEMLETMGVALQDQGHLERAIEHLGHALEIFQSQRPPAPRATARTLIRIAKAELTLGRPQAAVVRLELAEQLLCDAGAQPVELGSVRLSLAQVLWSLGGDPSRTVALARLARDAFAGGGSSTRAQHQEAQAWINGVARSPRARPS